MGTRLPSNERDPNPYGEAAKILLGTFDKLVNDYYGKLVAQTHFKVLFDSFKPSVDKTTHELVHLVPKLQLGNAYPQALLDEPSLYGQTKIWA